MTRLATTRKLMFICLISAALFGAACREELYITLDGFAGDALLDAGVPDTPGIVDLAQDLAAVDSGGPDAVPDKAAPDSSVLDGVPQGQ